MLGNSGDWARFGTIHDAELALCDMNIDPLGARMGRSRVRTPRVSHQPQPLTGRQEWPRPERKEVDRDVATTMADETVARSDRQAATPRPRWLTPARRRRESRCTTALIPRPGVA